MGTRGLISSPSLAAQRARPSEISPHRGGDNGASDIKSCLAHHSKEQRKGARVTFQNGEHPEELASNSSHKLRPLLGYDWIAGVLDVEKSLQGRSDDFYEELQDFRMQNESECMHKSQAKFSPEKQSVLSLFADTDDPIADADTHQCTFLYKLNSRLFPVPVHPGECCPVCRRPKSSHPHTINKPALVRVSIPSSTLLPSYNYKAHRRSSFDSTDSLGLPSCVDDSSRVPWPTSRSPTSPTSRPGCRGGPPLPTSGQGKARYTICIHHWGLLSPALSGPS
uniref:Migration and invasion inhibitory protein n=2 Tax=Hippocampus comes TaxID=109280 RepID=A0A3Q2Z8B2_HIPCM